ncbi:tripartite motif-containing protein 2-like [Antedon mediterranea]|uniref:tripartite motif-containing protein 2-like n=1 Tax=Antedon mediterranea TaxID=105859 RepID=UPI003AF66E83
MTTNSLEELKSDFLNCQICMEECVKPKLLECLHFFCEHCLSKWKRNKRIECPTCREVTVLQNGSTSSLKSMFFVSSMIDAIKSKMEKVSEHSVCGGSDKVKFTNTRCQYHGERMNFYCKKCRKLVCRDCIVLDHPKPNHWCVNLSEAASHARHDIEQSIANIDEMQTQLSVAESKLMLREGDVKASVARAESELEKIYDASLKALKTKRDNMIQALSANDKRHLSETKSAIFSSTKTLSKLAEFFSNLQVNGEEFDLAYSHADVLKKTNEISAVKVPMVQQQSSKIRFQPNMVCLVRQKAPLSTLGLVSDQEIDLKIELRPSDMCKNQQDFLVRVIRQAYKNISPKQPHVKTTPEEYKEIMNTRMRHISNRLGETYGEFWICVMGGNCLCLSKFTYGQVVIVNDCEKILVCKQPDNSSSINLSCYEARILESNGHDSLDARVCRIVNRAITTCKYRERLCNELRKRLQQSLPGREWHVLLAHNFSSDDFFACDTEYYVKLEVADEKLVIFQMKEHDCYC